MQRLSLFVAALGLSTSVFAGSADDVAVVDAYVRQGPPNASSAGAFMVLKNAGKAEAKLVKAANPQSQFTELHTHLNDNGVMRMRQIPEIVVPAGGETTLQPGGLHVMLINLKAPLTDGQTIPMTLGFADGSSKQVDMKVMRMAMPAGMPMKHSGH